MAMIGTALSAITGVIGAVMQGNAAAEAANYKAAIAERNRKRAEDNAIRIEQTAQIEQQELDQRNRGYMGTQTAVQSASGLSLGGKSQQMTRKSAKEISRLESLRLRHNAQIDVHNTLIDAWNYGAEAKLYKMEAKSSKTAGYIGGFTSLVGAAKGFLT